MANFAVVHGRNGFWEEWMRVCGEEMSSTNCLFFPSTFLMMILSTSTSVWQSVYIHSVRTLLFLPSEWRYITYLGCSSCKWQKRDSRSRVGKCGMKTTTIWWRALSPKWTVAFSIRTWLVQVKVSRLWESQNAFLFYVFWFCKSRTSTVETCLFFLH